MIDQEVTNYSIPDEEVGTVHTSRHEMRELPRLLVFLY